MRVTRRRVARGCAGITNILEQVPRMTRSSHADSFLYQLHERFEINISQRSDQHDNSTHTTAKDDHDDSSPTLWNTLYSRNTQALDVKLLTSDNTVPLHDSCHGKWKSDVKMKGICYLNRPWTPCADTIECMQFS